MNLRAATEADLPRLKELWLAFEAEIPAPSYVNVDREQELGEIEEIVREQVAVLAERDGDAVGFALAKMKGSKLGFVSDLYVVPDARRERVAQALTREAVAALSARGAEAIQLEVQVDNGDARSVYERWGFRETLLTLTADAGELEQRLGRDEPQPSVGRVYAQTDDVNAIERATAQFIPRMGRSGRTVVEPPRNGWICVDDELCSGDPKLLRRLAQELSYRTGGVVLSLGIEEGAVVRYVLFERGVGRRRIRLTPGVLRSVAAGRRDRAERQSDGGRAADRSRRRPPARGGADRVVAGRSPSSARSCSQSWPPCSGVGSEVVSLTLYDAARCPYCARVRIVLAEKGIPYDEVEIDLSDKPAWLYEKNPLGKVPVLEEGAFCLPESVVIMEYLEERYPEPALLPADPAERAAVRLAIWRFDAHLGDDYYAVRRGDEGGADRLEERLRRLDAVLEGQPYIGGASYSLADHAYLPWLVRAEANLGVDLAQFPSLQAWLERLSARPAVAAELELVTAPRPVMPSVVDASWVADHLGDEDLRLADVRGPNAHMRGHLPGSIPLVLGVPGQFTDADVLRGVRLRSRLCACAGTVSRGRSGSCSTTVATACRPRRRCRWPSWRVTRPSPCWPAASPPGRGELEAGIVELEKTRVELEPSLDAVPHARRDRVPPRRSGPRHRRRPPRRGVRGHGRLSVRSAAGAHPGRRCTSRSRRCSPAPVCPGRRTRYARWSACPRAPKSSPTATRGRALALAAMALRAAGYRARNYLGSWHEWSRHPELPVER